MCNSGCGGCSKPSTSGAGDASAPVDACVPPCPCVPIAAIKILSVEFASDHNLLKNYAADWDDGGARFPKPEWTPANQHPISHTMDKPVELKVKIEVSPPNACPETGTLRGEGPGGMVFEKSGYTFRPGQDTIPLKSDRNLDKKIQELDFKVSWTTKGTSVSISPSQTANTMYVTMDTPTTPPRRPGITLKRMRQAVKATGGAGSVNPHGIVKHVMSKWSTFNLNQVYDNEWELADDRTYPPGDPKAGQLVGADCQTIVRYTESVIKMVGCPGKAEFIVVWAKVPTPAHGEENPAYTPNVANPKQWYNSFRPFDAAKAKWRATLLDSSGGHNKYEACLRFTYPEASSAPADKKYYAGGVGVKNNPDEVIRVFTSMNWKDDDTNALRDVIYSY